MKDMKNPSLYLPSQLEKELSRFSCAKKVLG